MKFNLQIESQLKKFFQMGLVAILIVVCVEASEQQNQNGAQDPPVNDIQFDVPDLVTFYHFGDDEHVQLEAYKVRNQEQWVSIGYPLFVHDTNGSIYQFTPESIKMRIRLLPDDQKQELEREAKRKNPNLLSPIITLIPLQQFTCKSTFIHDDNKTYTTMNGKVHDLTQLSATLKIPHQMHSEIRRAFESRIKKAHEHDLDWDCKFTADGKEIFTNKIQVTGEQIQDGGLASTLFGAGQEAYVTRDQMNKFAQEIRSKIAIEEEYDIIDKKFDEKIMNQLLNLTVGPFQRVSFDEALEKLSKFGTEYDERDLAADEIKRELSRTLSIHNEYGKEYIRANQSTEDGETNVARDQASVTASGGVNAWLWKTKVTASGNIARINENRWKNTDLSIDEQLRELNSANTQGIEWEIVGSRIVPKSLNVVKISKAQFNRGISIAHKRRVLKDAKFKKTIVLHSHNSIPDMMDAEARQLLSIVNDITRFIRGPIVQFVNIVLTSGGIDMHFKVHADTSSYTAALLFNVIGINGTAKESSTIKTGTYSSNVEIWHKAIHPLRAGVYRLLIENEVGSHSISFVLGMSMIHIIEGAKNITIMINRKTSTIELHAACSPRPANRKCGCQEISDLTLQVTHGFFLARSLLNWIERSHYDCFYDQQRDILWIDLTEYTVKENCLSRNSCQ